MKSSLFLLALFGLFAFIKRADLIDSGQELFFPKATYQKIHDFSSFQIAAWNNIVIKDSVQAHKLCRDLRDNHSEEISKIMCETELSEFAPLVESYLKDQFLLFPAPTPSMLQNQASMEMAKLSLLMGPESQNILNLMRLDPLNYKDQLLTKVQSIMNDSFSWKDGLLTSIKDQTVIIPVQFSFKAEEIHKTKKIMDILVKYDAAMVGPNEGFLSNRSAIENDLDKVGIIGFLTVALFLAGVIYLKLFKLIKLIIPTALGICVSFVITWLIYGKVHGITLAFGTGIIGLAIDYGFHFVFSKDKGMAWKSNLYALLTTLVVFLIFVFSSVPLIRQMMIFSTVGLVASYIFSRILLINDHIDVKLDIRLKKSKWHALSLLVAMLGIFHFISFKVDTSIQRFNFTPPETKKAQEWFYSQVKKEKIFFKVYEKEKWPEMESDFNLLKDKGVRTESVYGYIPTIKAQNENLASWNTFKENGFSFKGDEAKIFAPFMNELASLNTDSRIDFSHPPEFLAHLAKNDKVVSLWFSKDENQEKSIRDNIPQVDSLMDIVTGFTELLSNEVKFFMPLTILAIWALLMFRYMNFKKALVCLIPFLFSLGLYGILYRYFNFPLSFMSLLGLFLIYGLSVDYGIFSTDFFMNDERDFSEESSLNLSLIVNWVSGIVGFLPLLWCEHPILKDLGLVLVIGMFGIFYSTFFVIPAIFDFGRKT